MDKTGPGVSSHRGRLSVKSEDGNATEGTGNESNYGLIRSGRHHHHHHKRSYSYSSNSSSSSLGSPLWSPLSSGRAASQAAGVPFSWEDRPGVPKQKPDASDDFRELRRLPLADPHGSARRRRSAKKRSDDDDPFVTALVECMKDARVSQRRSSSTYSCMRACATVDSQIALPRAKISKQGSQECKKQNAQNNGRNQNADKSSLHEPLLSSNKCCRSENANTELVVCQGKILRQQQQTSWNVEFCRSVLHR